MPQMLCLQKNVQPSNPYVKEESLKMNDPTVQLKQINREGEKGSEQIKPKNVGEEIIKIRAEN